MGKNKEVKVVDFFYRLKAHLVLQKEVIMLIDFFSTFYDNTPHQEIDEAVLDIIKLLLKISVVSDFSIRQ
jgi:hypothetical protein